MFVWDYYHHVYFLFSETAVETYDVIIRFYVINICSWDPIQIENLEE